MIKTGVYSLQQINEFTDFKDIFGRDKRISITLYDQILQMTNAEEIAERILLTFTDDRGAYKRTYTNRFDEFDRKVLEILPQYFNANDTITVQEVAVSDGRSAVNFFEKIAKVFPNLSYQASDYSPKVYVIEQGRIKATLGHNANVIEIVYPPFVLNVIRSDSFWFHPLNRIIQTLAQKLVVQPLIKKYQAGEIKAKEIFLFCPLALNLVTKDQRFKLSQYNVLQQMSEKSQIVRAMNILNITYFTQNEFRIVLRNIHAGLQQDGIFITGSNQGEGSIVNGGIYQKTEKGFKKIWQSGSGSPVQDLITVFTID